ncbi:hypothetical protein ABHF33_00180 [Chitinibacter sp. FCG-7]|uniref:Uncharacterized protein n=1 Tax=Chitinibacter mangrovi TaxID=3153927 RepID=A0AAU7FAV3_9NEIS
MPSLHRSAFAILLVVTLTSFVFLWEALTAWQTNSMDGRCLQKHPGAICTHAQRVGEYLFQNGTAAQGYATLLATIAFAMLLCTFWCWRRLKEKH